MVRESVARDKATVARIGAVPSILQMVCTATGMRFAAVARVTEDTWIACAVRDEIDFGLKAGGELPLKTTNCDEIRHSGRAIIVDHVSEDPHFRTHHTPRLYGFQSYISVPIVRTNGDFFGTLCALDPHQEGLGLGLYIAYQIAAAHNGTLSVDSTPASTTITLSMPAGK